MDLPGLTEQLRELLEYELQKYSVTQPIPKLKKKPGSGQGYGDKSGAEPAKTNASRPSSLAKGGDDGDGTKAGVKPKSLGGRDNVGTAVTPKTKTSAGTKKKAPAAGKPTSCPGGGQPRMVFGQWRCTGGGKGAQKAKSRIGAKRKKKAAPKKPIKKGALAALVHKAREAFKGLFK